MPATGPDGVVNSLQSKATKIKKCPAVCPICGRDAHYTHRKIDSLDEIAIGGSDLYEPRCWYHHGAMNQKESCSND